MRKFALLSMDVEDWYHLEYFRGAEPSRRYSMLDGLDRFRSLLADERIPATFFTLEDIAREIGSTIRSLIDEGHEVASHGPDHALLTGQGVQEFVEHMRRHKAELEQVAGSSVAGYRAPCFSMDREKLERLPELGFRYDSSWIRFDEHPLYGSMDLEDWDEVKPGIRRAPDQEFFEFEVPTLRLGSRQIPIGGGAYFRVFPWTVTRSLVSRFLADAEVYVFYIHPFECSARRELEYPAGTTVPTRMRFQLGRMRTLPRLRRLIGLLRDEGFTFTTFGAVSRELGQ